MCERPLHYSQAGSLPQEFPKTEPPNHKMIDVAVSYNATDNCDEGAAVSCALAVASNEPIDGLGDAFSQDGGPQPGIVFRGVTGEGSTSSFEIDFISTPGAVTRVIRVATFESTLVDIRNSRALGLIDSDGIAQALSSKIEAARAAAERGQNRASINILNAFEAFVGAQAQKHIDAIAGRLLIEDADSLIAQLGAS